MLVNYLKLSFYNSFAAVHSYWTGYYTSRPSFKFFERQSNAFLQAAKQINVLAGGGSDNEKDPLETLKHAVSVAQHHDAITGTAKQPVDDDYNLRLL